MNEKNRPPTICFNSLIKEPNLLLALHLSVTASADRQRRPWRSVVLPYRTLQYRTYCTASTSQCSPELHRRLSCLPGKYSSKGVTGLLRTSTTGSGNKLRGMSGACYKVSDCSGYSPFMSPTVMNQGVSVQTNHVCTLCLIRLSIY